MLKKKGLSPVIATTLLIVLVIILAAILWVWIRSFIGEKVIKDGQAIENFCDKIQFNADVYLEGNTLKVDIENQGNVPLYGVEIKKQSLASLRTIGDAIPSSQSIPSGETSSIEVSGSTTSVTSGQTVIVIPMLMGKVGEITKYYTCDKQFGIEKDVK
jgi:flagellin-like protein